jgi:signal transduction histidine kinase
MRIMKLAVASELDVVGARQRAREIAALCHFGLRDQVRVATSVSELARNLYNYAVAGKVEFAIVDSGKGQALQIRITDQGPGIAQLESIMGGQYQSHTGAGLGILGAQRLMDSFEIRSVTAAAAQAGSAPVGTEIVLRIKLPPEAPHLSVLMVGQISTRLAASAPESMLSEVQQQNQELLGTLAELKARQEELLKLTRDLEETNRGVRVLYEELDEKAQHLRQADELKSRFLSNMSHEFRTPLSSIRALAKLLLARADGELSIEQEKQVTYILQSTLALNEMVDDLLDLAKIEAGKVNVRAESFMVHEMFTALRGVMRPLVLNPALTLTFDETPPGMALDTDQAKLMQILRNFISNALKFTERGAVTVRALALPEQDAMRFDVTDTGIGIPAGSLNFIFEEFNQVENHLQANAKGTGLGLPLCRKLADLLGGSVAVASSVGAGSTFSVTLPLRYTPVDDGLRPTPISSHRI